MNRSLIVSAAATAIASIFPAAYAADVVLQDSFENGVVENSDTQTGFWTQRNSGGTSSAGESGGALQLTAGGSQYPHAQLASQTQQIFNFFRAPLVIQGSGINFTSPTSSLNKAILRFSLSSRTLLNNDDSEYVAEDVLAFRIESGNLNPGEYTVALGIKENNDLANSEYDGFWLFNPIINSGAVLSGPLRNFTLAYSPKFWDLTMTHDTSPSDPTPVTVHFTGGVDQFISNWSDTLAPGPITGDSAMFVQSQLNNALGTEQATAHLNGLTVSKLVQNWQGGGTGNWGDSANWSDANILHLNGDGATSSVPNFTGANVRFPNSATPTTIVLSADQTVGALTFDSAQSYTIQPDGGGQGTLQVDTRWFRNEIVVLQGTHAIASPMRLYKDTTISVGPAASVLTLSGGMEKATGVATASIAKEGAGRVDLPNVRFTGLSINGGTVKTLTNVAHNDPIGASNVNSLAIAGGPTAPTARLDLANNAMVIDYGSATPIDDVRQYLLAGLGGNGIITSSGSTTRRLGYGEGAELIPGGGIFAGQNIDATSIIIAYALAGDTNLDNTVEIGDFATLTSNFNAPGRWTKGDFDYDGVVAISDFALLASNFNQVLSGDVPRSAVPEPVSFAGVIAAMALLRRR